MSSEGPARGTKVVTHCGRDCTHAHRERERDEIRHWPTGTGDKPWEAGTSAPCELEGSPHLAELLVAAVRVWEVEGLGQEGPQVLAPLHRLHHTTAHGPATHGQRVSAGRADGKRTGATVWAIGGSCVETIGVRNPNTTKSDT